MNYHKFSLWDTANGKGIGVVLWVAGCSHHCEGCHNPETWDPRSGMPWGDQSMTELIKHLDHPHVKRLTITGGDPLYATNRASVEKIAKQVKTQFSDKQIWLYTGYVWEDVSNWSGLKYVDVLVDGKFDVSQKNLTLPYSGSTNQRVIDVVQTLNQSHIVLV